MPDSTRWSRLLRHTARGKSPAKGGMSSAGTAWIVVATMHDMQTDQMNANQCGFERKALAIVSSVISATKQ